MRAKDTPTAVCQFCGNVFPVKYPRNPNKYCSRSCRGRAQRPPRRRPPALFICQHCGKEFESRNRSNPNHYCSYACRDAAKKPLPASQTKKQRYTCPTCGQYFWRYPAHVKVATPYCSRACDPHFADQRVIITCENCGKVAWVKSYYADRRFCRDACRLAWFSRAFRGEQSPQWQGGRLPYYGPNWRQQRKAARKRDNDTCQHCGRTSDELPRRVAVHHRIPFREFGIDRYLEANDLDNLICLCDSCHQRLERRMQREARTNGG